MEVKKKIRLKSHFSAFLNDLHFLCRCTFNKITHVILERLIIFKQSYLSQLLKMPVYHRKSIYCSVSYLFDWLIYLFLQYCAVLVRRDEPGHCTTRVK